MGFLSALHWVYEVLWLHYRNSGGGGGVCYEWDGSVEGFMISYLCLRSSAA